MFPKKGMIFKMEIKEDTLMLDKLQFAWYICLQINGSLQP